MWVMIVKDIAVETPPVFMGIYWAIPWPDQMIAAEQARHTAILDGLHEKTNVRIHNVVKSVACPLCFAKAGDLCTTKSGVLRHRPHQLREMAYVPDGTELVDPDEHHVPGIWGHDPNWNGAMRILVKGSQIRIFPHEFSKLEPANMRAYVLGLDCEEPTHELQAGNAAEEDLVSDVLEGTRKIIYEEALVDGCTEAQAMQVALGINIEVPDADFPPVGWYRPKWGLLEMFMREPQLQRVRANHGYWGDSE